MLRVGGPSLSPSFFITAVLYVASRYFVKNSGRWAARRGAARRERENTGAAKEAPARGPGKVTRKVFRFASKKESD